MNPRRTSPAAPRTDLRAFCGAAFPWPLIDELVDGSDVRACYLVHESRRAETKQNKPYIRVVLGDRTGVIEGVIWDDTERWEPACAAEGVVGVQARVGSYQDRLQLRISTVHALDVDPADYEYLLPASPRPREEMERELDALVGSVSDPALRKLLGRCVGRGTELGRAYRSHPAAKRNHHAYVCGLLEHSVSVAANCDRLAQRYLSTGADLDRDLLVTAALLHDIGKIRELKGFPAIGYTDEGKLLGHIVIGIQMVAREAEAIPGFPRDRLLLLLHLVASHQGKPEWDSPRMPQILEGLILHYADDLDAKLNQAGALLAAAAPGEWSGYDRSLERSFFRPGDVAGPPEEEKKPSRARKGADDRDLAIDLFRASGLEPEPGTPAAAAPEKGAKCPACGYRNESDALFCGVCGVDLA